MTSTGPSTGRLGDPSAVRRLQLDDVVATYVVDGAMLMQAEGFFPVVPSEFWAANPGILSEDGLMPMSAGGLLVERDGSTVLIDAGVGVTSATYPLAEFDFGAMIDVLESVGHRPEDIDVVAFTHLHFDHAGWAFANGERTFPNARYVLSQREWAPYSDGSAPTDPTTPLHVIQRLATAEAVELVDDGDEIAPGVHAVVTPGHSPGHTSYVVTSRTGRRLVAFGDAFHMPGQLTYPEWVSVADGDPVGVIDARHRLLAELAESHTFGFGFHFGDQPFGQVVTDSNRQVAWQPVPTSTLAPAPRPSR